MLQIDLPVTEPYGPPEPYHCGCGRMIPGDYEFCGPCLGFDDELDMAVVAVIPPCDFTAEHPGQSDRPAVVDGVTSAGTWAFMCDPCHRLHGNGLGAGRGQRLALAS